MYIGVRAGVHKSVQLYCQVRGPGFFLYSWLDYEKMSWMESVTDSIYLTVLHME